ncbi:MAG: DUF5060 domain-containing protein [Haliscomenobacter sp.]|nr:DUF5060 domain-containing protein [Haliscomenobacter sp.]MBK8652483.1 DUF5060 domain-containing protein [Haliscomenobacter sp.]MBP9075226.1 DUF5060 domain-containing protein [Haliscomenobacter sp.]MBP9872399.1 DUF5060 domain-containing protein [Haliscomenobacter sp.]
MNIHSNGRRIQSLFLAAVCASNLAFGQSSSSPVLSGELKKWHTVTLTFEGPHASEQDPYNPFLNYRLNVLFSKGDKQFLVPGYFAADGNAANTSAENGNRWRVRFTPDEVGDWKYQVFFRKGENIAVNDDPGAGVPAGFMDGQSGAFSITSSDKTGRDFRAKGRLQYVGEHYLRFAETGEYFLKAGADSPENILSFADFDGTFKNDQHKDNLVKTWSAHLQDWKEGDPVWGDNKGKALIGALNYLASKGMNVFSFLTFNILGDDQNVFPYVSYTDFFRMDVSKLDQWEMIFDHGQKKGLYLHFKTQEHENQGLLDSGAVDIQRKLYYRELIARFSHHLALNWNLGEENGRWVKNHPTPPQTTAQRLAMAQYFFDHDPYRHHIVIHNGQSFDDLLGPESKLTGVSVQGHHAETRPHHVHEEIIHWRRLSEKAGKRWVVALDEPGSAGHSLLTDAEDPNHDIQRQNVLWGALTAGGAGVEWYFGYQHPHSDLSCEDWRSRDRMWDQSRYALEFFSQNKLPFWEMEAKDEITKDTLDYVFCKPGASGIYLVYQRTGKKLPLVLEGVKGRWEVIWFNPRTGEGQGAGKKVKGKINLEIGLPPSDQERDWVALVRKPGKR